MSESNFLMAAAGPFAHDDIYRFVALRAVNLPEPDALARRFVKSGLPDSYDDIEALLGYPAKPLLMIEIPLLSIDQHRSDNVMEAVAKFRSQSPYGPDSLKSLFLLFERLRETAIWHRDHNQNHDATTADFIDEVEKALGKSCSDFLGEDGYPSWKISVWENLVAEYISPTSQGELLAQLVDAAR